jgi:acetyl-CoA carboxylase alpha subunit
MMTIFDFEKPITELENAIEELRRLAIEKGIDRSREIAELESSASSSCARFCPPQAVGQGAAGATPETTVCDGLHPHDVRTVRGAAWR